MNADDLTATLIDIARAAAGSARTGSIVFSIGLTDAARKAELTPQMVEDALYVLANIDKVLDARKAGIAA